MTEKSERFDILYQDYDLQSAPQDDDIQYQQIFKLYDSPILVYFIKDKVILDDYETQRYRFFEDHHKQITSIAVSPTHNLVASCDIDGRLMIWNPIHPQLIIFDKIEIGSCATSMVFSSDGTKLIICQKNSGKLLYNLDTKTKKELTGQSQVAQVCFKNSRPYAFSACSNNGQISFFDWRYDYLKTLNVGQYCTCCIYNQSDLLVGSISKKIYVYTKTELAKEIETNHAVYYMIGFDKYIIVLEAQGEIQILDQEYNIVNSIQIKTHNVKIDCKSGIQLQKDILRIYLNNGLSIDLTLQQLLETKEISESELQIKLNGQVQFLNNKYLIKNNLIYDRINKVIINNQQVISKIMDIFEFNNNTYFVSKTEIYILNKEEYKLCQYYKFDDNISNITSFYYNQGKITIVYLTGIALFDIESKQIEIKYKIQLPFVSIACSTVRDNLIAISLQPKSSIAKQKLVIIDSDKEYAQSIGQSSYFANNTNLKFVGQYLVACSGSKYCAFKINQFDEKDDDIWPFNAQMDYLQQIGAQTSILQLNEFEIIVCGQRGAAIWDLQIKSIKKHYKWLLQKQGVEQVEQLDEENIFLYTSEGFGIQKKIDKY